MVILDKPSADKYPRFVKLKNRHKKEVIMEIEFYFKFVRKPKNKKVTVVLEDEQ